MRVSSLRLAVHTSSVDRSGIAAMQVRRSTRRSTNDRRVGSAMADVIERGLSVAAAGRTVPAGRTGMALLAVSFWINPPLAAAPELPEPG